MLFTNLRKYTKTIMWIIAIFIVPAFVIWNIGSAIRNRRSGYAGKIFDEKINWQTFFEEKLAARNEAWMRYGDKLDPSIDLDEQTWTRLILLSEAKKRNIKVSGDELLTYIKNLPVFRFSALDSQTYAEIVARLFQQRPNEFEQGIRHSLLINKLLEQVTGAISVTDTEIKEKYIQEFEQASGSYVLFDPKNFTDAVTGETDTELKNYYEKNKQAFKAPEQVNVRYIEVKIEKFKNDIEITEERIQKYYENNKEKYKIADENKKEKENQTVQYQSLGEVRDLIRDKLLEKEMTNHAQDLARQLLNKLYDDENFENAAQAYGLSVQETGPFSMLEEIPNVGLNFAFLKAAFSLKKGEISEIVHTPTAFYIIKLIEKIAPHIPEYEKIIEKVRQAYKNAEAAKLARKKAEDILSQIKDLVSAGNMDFEAAAKKLEVETKEVADFTRLGYIRGLGYAKEFIDVAFSLKPQEISNIIDTPRGFCILQLKRIIAADEEQFEKEKETYRNKVLLEKRNEFLNNWFVEIKEKANPVSYLENNTQAR
ncbi:MAG: peptidyl-prolyl cis-trans isomerase [Candidatus Omnitrophota bacterium]